MESIDHLLYTLKLKGKNGQKHYQTYLRIQHLQNTLVLSVLFLDIDVLKMLSSKSKLTFVTVQCSVIWIEAQGTL